LQVIAALALLQPLVLITPGTLLFGIEQNISSNTNLMGVSVSNEAILNPDKSITYSSNYLRFKANLVERDFTADLSLSSANQSYLFANGEHNLKVQSSNIVPAVYLSYRDNKLYISPTQQTLFFSYSVANVNLGAGVGHIAVPVEVSYVNLDRALDTNISTKLESNYCELSLSIDIYAISTRCVLEGDEISYRSSKFLIEEEAMFVYLQHSYGNGGFLESWNSGTLLSGSSQFDIQSENYGLKFGLNSWTLGYSYSDIKAGIFNTIQINNDLLAGLGKGTYYVNVTAEAVNHSINLELPVTQILGVNITPIVALSGFNNIDIKSDTYEPLLFLGIPLLTDTDYLNIDSLMLGLTQVQLSYLKGNWTTIVQIQQQYLLDYKRKFQRNESAELLNKDISPHAQGANDVTSGNEKAGFWPGFSAQIEIQLKF